MSDERAERMGRKIVEKAKSLSLNSRNVYVTNDKLLKKADKVQLASRSNTGMFAQQLILIRRKLKHRGLQLIKPGTPDWINLKEVTKLATEFSNEFSMNIKQGYREYIETGMGMIKNFSIFKFKGIHAAICNRYEVLQEIREDSKPDSTELIHNYYLGIISEKTGLTQGYKAIPEKYVYFIRARKEADKLGIGLKDYIKAQFGAFEWKSGIPDPMQLVGVKAVERVQKYAYENGIKLGPQSRTINFKQIKGAKKETKGKNNYR